MQIWGSPVLNARKDLAADLLETNKVDVLQIWGSPRAQCPETLVADLLATTKLMCCQFGRPAQWSNGTPHR